MADRNAEFPTNRTDNIREFPEKKSSKRRAKKEEVVVKPIDIVPPPNPEEERKNQFAAKLRANNVELQVLEARLKQYRADQKAEKTEENARQSGVGRIVFNEPDIASQRESFSKEDEVRVAQLRVQNVAIRYKYQIGGEPARTEEEYIRNLGIIYDSLTNHGLNEGYNYLATKLGESNVITRSGKRQPILVVHQIKMDVDTGKAIESAYSFPITPEV